jgi:hypothetical protein
MRKVLIAVAAFLLSAMLGMLLMVVGELLVILPGIAAQKTSGISAVAGGVSTLMGLLVPILCGVLGTVIVLRRLNRRQSVLRTDSARESL